MAVQTTHMIAWHCQKFKCYSAHNLIKSRNPVFATSISATNLSPMIGIMKITNPVMIIFNAPEPEASPKARLANPVKAKMNARISKRNTGYTFQKDPDPLDQRQSDDNRE